MEDNHVILKNQLHVGNYNHNRPITYFSITITCRTNLMDNLSTTLQWHCN